MTTAYRAMLATAPGVLTLVTRPTPVPDEGEVSIEVDACGVCGADASDIESAALSPQNPRVPGHEVVGRIAALGPAVPSIWHIGQRVGVGRLGGHCNACPSCRQGQFQLCLDQPVMGSSRDGGYAERMLARATGLVAIPDTLDTLEAAPLLCAGIATFNALKKCGAEAGDTVAILGIGGLGHMAIQYARNMGFKVIAIGRGPDKAAPARSLGAHVYIDSEEVDATAELRALGGAQAIVSTVGQAGVAAGLMPGLAPQGRLVVLAAGKAPLPIAGAALVGGERAVVGSITGTPYESERTLAFSVLAGIRPWMETMPLARAAEAYGRLKRGDVRFRMVLTMQREP